MDMFVSTNEVAVGGRHIALDDAPTFCTGLMLRVITRAIRLQGFTCFYNMGIGAGHRNKLTATITTVM